MTSCLSSYEARPIGRLCAVAAVLLLVPAAMAFAGGDHEGVINTTDGVAIEGYDPVAYFTLGEPTQGSDVHVHEWDGAQWWFASAEHLEMFASDPERYAPRYGGYCSFAAARNQVATGDPLLWTIEDDRLYLNLNERFQRQFRDDLPGNIAAADENWPALRERLAASAAE